MRVEKDLDFFVHSDSSQIIHYLKSSETGIKERDAIASLKLHGKNILAHKKESHIIVEFLSHFRNPLIIILLLASVAAAYFGEVANAIIIASIILMSVTLEFYLEHDAKRAALKLQDQVKTRALVIRDAKERRIDIEHLVPGDIVLLRPGSIIPADARVIFAKDFFVNESGLTGESFPAEKVSQPIRASGETGNLVFMGTHVISGEATAIIIRTGSNTEYGKIAERLEQKVETDFDKGIARFGFLIMKTTMILVLSIFLFNVIFRHNYLEAFLFSIAVAVGLTPELLPMIMSVTMARGSMDMAKKGAIVKRLTSIPNFGSMDILCTDKTGTLTEDHIRLVTYTDVSGAHSEDVLLHTYLNSFHQSGVQNPLDKAVLEFKKVKIAGYKKIDEIPFDFVRKRMSIVVSKSNKRFLITKGAPEEIFRCCTTFRDKRKTRHITSFAKFQKQYDDLSSQGYRVLAVAIKQVQRKKLYEKHDEKELELLGFVSFLDPPRQDLKHVIQEIREMGIDIRVVTGDNELVTKKICSEIGLQVTGVLLGDDIRHLSDEALQIKAEKTTIFARFSPQEKSRVILALKAKGHVVGYLGDGINDSPPLVAADVGISVSTAVDVAKEAAAIVLTRKSLHELKEGVLEGRKIFGNTLKYIMMSLSSNFGNMFSVAIATLFLPFLPMLPIQILLNNFIYDISQVTIPTDNVDADFIRKPKRWNQKFIKNFMLTFGPLSSIFDLVTFILLFYIFKVPAAFFQTGWFMESLATQTLVIFVIRTKFTPFANSRPSRYLMLSVLGCLSVGWLLPFIFIGKFFGFVALPWFIVAMIVLIVVSYLLLVEVVKDWFYKKHDF